MFILPATALTDVAIVPEPATWLHALRLPLAFLASLILLTLARRFLPRPVPLRVQEKLVVASKTAAALPAAETPASARFSWLPRLTWETLPSTPAVLVTEKTKSKSTTLTTPTSTPRPTVAPPAPHARAPTRAGPVRRPEPALAPHVRVGVEAPLPALYSCPPVSMAKMIMSRHTYRRPSPPSVRHAASRAPSISHSHPHSHSRAASPAPSSSSSS